MKPGARLGLGWVAAAALAALAACGGAPAGEGAGGDAGTSGAAGVSGGGGTAGAPAGGNGAGGTGGAAGNGAGGAGGANPGGAGGNAQAGDGGAQDPPPGQYGTRAVLPRANSEMAVAEVNGKIYVLGGYPSTRVTQATVMVYDVAANSWSLAASMPVAIHHPVAAGVGGKLYSFGGQTDNGDIRRTLEYDPGTNQWRDLEPMPTPRGAGASAVIGDKVYVVGGRPPAGNAFAVYDVSDNQWTPLPVLPQTYPERNHLAAAAIGGKIYVAGGRYNGGGFASPMTDSLDVFDPGTGMWTQAMKMPRPRGGVNGVAAYGCFHVWGGEGGNIGEPNNVFPDHDVYNPLTNQWTSLPRLPTPIHGVTGAAFVNGLIYMPGGGTEQGGSSGSTIFQVFRPTMRCE